MLCTDGHLELGESEEHHREFELRLDMEVVEANGTVRGDREQLPFLLLSGIETGFDLNEGKYEKSLCVL